MSPAIDRLTAQESDARERRIDYVEFASIDPDASRAFFEAVFGWQFQAYGRITWPSTMDAWTAASTVQPRRRRTRVGRLWCCMPMRWPR